MADAPAQVADTPVGKPYALLALLQVHWFVRLRWVFVGGALGVLAIERFVLPDVRRPVGLLIAVLAVAAVNVIWTRLSGRLRREFAAPADARAAIREGQLFVSAQIAIDLLLLTVILALSGGVENPMAVFYLFHVAISGLLLRTWQAAIQSAWAVVLYASMCLAQAVGWLQYWPFLPHLGSADLHAVLPHVGTCIAVQILAVFGSLYFTDRIGKILDRREDMLIRMNAELVRSRQAIQDLQARRSRFMQVAAHQLKSPLAMVQTFANLIRDGIVTDPEGIQNTCEKIVRRSRDGILQVTELLTLARVQEADPRRHAEAASNVAAILTEVCGKFAGVAEEKGVQFECQAPANKSLQARVHPADLADCIGNLVENAIKYTPAGGRVRVTALAGRPRRPRGPRGWNAVVDSGQGDGQAGAFVYVIVRDTGIGISEPALTRATAGVPDGTIFDAFRRGHTAISAGIPGSGLGLSIVREVVQQAGGFVHVYSRPGEGSIFTVAFPAPGAPTDAPEEPTASSPHLSLNSVDTGHKNP